MSASRRDFLKTTAIAGATVAMEGLPALAEPMGVQTGRVSPGSHPADGPIEHTRGIGIYPGAPTEDFGPELVPGNSAYRNLALMRPAYHSSAYDYNLTAQLVTDGIKDTGMPRWIAVSDMYRGVLAKDEREILVDHFPTYALDLRGASPAIDIFLGGGGLAPEIDRVDLVVTAPVGVKPESLMFTIFASEDGRTWKEAGSVSAPQPVPVTGFRFGPQGDRFEPSIHLGHPLQSRYYRVACAIQIPGDNPFRGFFMAWRLGQVAFYRGNVRIEVGGPYNFTSAWMSAGSGEEWVYVNLGEGCAFDRVKLYWIARAAEGSLQVSDDAQNWRELLPLPAGGGQGDDLRLEQTTNGRYVRVRMTRPASPDGYVLSEIEVYGRGGFTLRPKAAPEAAHGRVELSAGAWRVQRSSLVNGDGEALSKTGYRDSEWTVATVPGTVLTSY